MSLATNDSKDGVTFTGATSNTIPTFTLLGGKYLFYATAAGTSTVLNILCPDGSTFTPANSQTTTAFAVAVDLPPGSYQIVVTSVSAVQGGLVKIPYRPIG